MYPYAHTPLCNPAARARARTTRARALCRARHGPRPPAPGPPQGAARPAGSRLPGNRGPRRSAGKASAGPRRAPANEAARARPPGGPASRRARARSVADAGGAGWRGRGGGEAASIDLRPQRAEGAPPSGRAPLGRAAGACMAPRQADARAVGPRAQRPADGGCVSRRVTQVLLVLPASRFGAGGREGRASCRPIQRG